MNRNAISYYLMRASFYLGLFFIVEYWLSLQAVSYLFLAFIAVTLKCVTPAALYVIVRRVRDAFLDGVISGPAAWLYGVRAMLFAALPEAAFIYVYHQFIDRGALLRMQQVMVEQLEKLHTLVGEQSLNTETIDLYRDADIPTAIQAAVNMISQDLLCGVFLMIPVALIVKRKTPASPTANSKP